MISILDQQLKAYFAKENNPFAKIMQLQGEVFRELEGRRTQRIQLAGKVYFIKQHFGVGWKEIFKNLLQGRLPVLSAKNEWQAIQRLEQLQIATPELSAFGCQGLNPARLQSFIITAELRDTQSLEDFCKEWKKHPPAFKIKKNLIESVAKIARTMHENGINHRDFYICHFLKRKADNENPKLYLIDLHRAQIRTKVPTRWLIKDLAGLYFSSKDIGLTQKDLLRFIKTYRGTQLRTIFNQEENFWLKVKHRGDKLFQKHEKN